jgi:4-hydroxy-3-methylbut-2-enyl diphosphate reductase
MTLLLLAPLRLEAMALASAPSHPRVTRTGMGPSRADAAMQRLLARRPVPEGEALALVGAGGGLADDLEVGDLVVAQKVVRPDGSEVAMLASAPLLAAELRSLGLRARCGTVASTDHLVTGAERRELARVADVVDMESAAVVARATGPVAVVRAVSDTASRELLSPAGLMGASRALASLRAATPALTRWAGATGPRKALLAEPRSFCAGVHRAIETVERALALSGPPVYVRRQIVHNASVVRRLERAGAVFITELEEAPDGATVVFSAHGVGTAVHEEAARRGMRAIDATCPLVSKVHHEARRYAAAGRQVVLVGHRGHDEVEGTLGTVPGTHLVEGPEDVRTLELDTDRPTAVVTQTTLALDEVAGTLAELDAMFKDLVHPNASDICYASQNRQEAVRAMAPACDLVLVVGSPNSSNCNRLVEVARRQGRPAHLVDTAADIRLAWLEDARTVGITAGASTPEELVQEVVSCLSSLGPLELSELATGIENVTFPLPVEVR